MCKSKSEMTIQYFSGRYRCHKWSTRVQQEYLTQIKVKTVKMHRDWLIEIILKEVILLQYCKENLKTYQKFFCVNKKLKKKSHPFPHNYNSVHHHVV